MSKILVLGGTTQASHLAQALAAGAAGEAGRRAVFSYAGRTKRPASQPLRSRLGGFGGVAGLVAYLRREAITHVVDATHPFAAQMSANAVSACDIASVQLCALERPAWAAQPGDRWQRVADTDAAVEALPPPTAPPARVFLAIGKQNVAVFARRPHHHYLLRLVDAPEGDLLLPHCSAVVARGPFDVAGDTGLMRAHGITHIVSKNAGGAGAVAKLHAARALGLPVIMIDRPALPQRLVLEEVADVVAWLAHG